MQLEKFNLPRTVIDLLAILEPSVMGLVYAALTSYIYNDDETLAESLTGDALDFYNEAKELISKQVRRARAYRRRKEEIAAGLRPAPKRRPRKSEQKKFPIQQGNVLIGEDGFPIPQDTPLSFRPDAPFYKDLEGRIHVHYAWPVCEKKVVIYPDGTSDRMVYMGPYATYDNNKRNP